MIEQLVMFVIVCQQNITPNMLHMQVQKQHTQPGQLPCQPLIVQEDFVWENEQHKIELILLSPHKQAYVLALLEPIICFVATVKECIRSCEGNEQSVFRILLVF